MRCGLSTLRHPHLFALRPLDFFSPQKSFFVSSFYLTSSSPASLLAARRVRHRPLARGGCPGRGAAGGTAEEGEEDAGAELGLLFPPH